MTRQQVLTRLSVLLPSLGKHALHPHMLRTVQLLCREWSNCCQASPVLRERTAPNGRGPLERCGAGSTGWHSGEATRPASACGVVASLLIPLWGTLPPVRAPGGHEQRVVALQPAQQQRPHAPGVDAPVLCRPRVLAQNRSACGIGCPSVTGLWPDPCVLTWHRVHWYTVTRSAIGSAQQMRTLMSVPLPLNEMSTYLDTCSCDVVHDWIDGQPPLRCLLPHLQVVA